MGLVVQKFKTAMSTVIKLENICKQYRLGTVGSQTLRGDLQRWWYNLCGKEYTTLYFNKLCMKKNDAGKSILLKLFL